LFEAMLTNLRQTVTQVLSHLEIRAQPRQVVAAEAAEPQTLQATGTDHAQPMRAAGAPPSVALSRPVVAASNPGPPPSWGKVPRNAPCPCGSGKKYKHCHGRLT
jgi:preprotein translocase subunit SecA